MSEDKDALDFDLEDGNPDGLESLTAEQIADKSHPYGEVTAEDLDTRELVYDGADAATMVPDDPATPVDAAFHTDDMATEESIEERLAQEQPDPAAEVAYGEEVEADLEA